MRPAHAVAFAAIVTAPVASLLWILLMARPDFDWYLVVLVFIGVIPAFICCAAGIALLGLPASRLLERLKFSSRGAYTASGALIGLIAVAASFAYDWCCLQSGPFQLSLRERLEVFGASYVAMSYLRAAAFASICGALAACMFWIAKHRGVREASKTIV